MVIKPESTKYFEQCMVKEIKENNTHLLEKTEEFADLAHCDYPCRKKFIFPPPSFFQKYPDIKIVMFVVPERTLAVFGEGVYHSGGISTKFAAQIACNYMDPGFLKLYEEKAKPIPGKWCDYYKHYQRGETCFILDLCSDDCEHCGGKCKNKRKDIQPGKSKNKREVKPTFDCEHPLPFLMKNDYFERLSSEYQQSDY